MFGQETKNTNMRHDFSRNVENVMAISGELVMDK
jgi:hypothetical protein